MNHESSESLPASTTDNPVVEPPTPRARLQKRLVFGGAVVAIVAGGIFALQGKGEAAPSAAAAAADVPKVTGEQIRYSDTFAQRAGIKLSKVRFDQLVPVVAAVGTADFNAEHVAAVGTRLRGLVSSVRKFEGDVVESGAILARIESAELGEAQAAVSMLAAERHAAELNAEREARLAERSLTTAREVELASVEAKKAGLLLGAAQQKVAALGGSTRPSDVVLGAHEVRSPIAGTIDALPFHLGEKPQQGATVAILLANTAPFARVHVPEPIRSRVKVGTPATLEVDGIERTFKGQVRFIASEAEFTPYYSLTATDRSRLSFLAEVVVDDPEGSSLPSGVPVEVTLSLAAP